MEMPAVTSTAAAGRVKAGCCESPGIFILRGELCESDGRWEDASRHYSSAIIHAGARLDRLAEAVDRLARCQGRYADGRHMIQPCRDAIQRVPPRFLAARALLSARAAGLTVLGGLSGHDTYGSLAKAWMEAESSGNREAAVECRTILGLCAHLPMGNFKAAEGAFEAARADLAPDRDSLARRHLLTLRMLVGVVRGESPTRPALVTQPLAGAGTFVGQAERLTLAMAAFVDHRLEAAEAWLQSMEKSPVPAQLRPWYFRTRCLLGLRSGRGTVAEAAARAMKRALDDVGPAGLYAPECAHALALLHLRRGKRRQAERVLSSVLFTCLVRGFPFWEMKTHMLLAACSLRGGCMGDGAGRDSLARALELSRRSGFDGIWRSDGFEFVGPLLDCAVREGVCDIDAHRLIAARDGVGPTPWLEIRAFSGLVARGGELHHPHALQPPLAYPPRAARRSVRGFDDACGLALAARNASGREPYANGCDAIARRPGRRLRHRRIGDPTWRWPLPVEPLRAPRCPGL